MTSAVHVLANPLPQIPAYVPAGNECALFEQA